VHLLVSYASAPGKIFKTQKCFLDVSIFHTLGKGHDFSNRLYLLVFFSTTGSKDTVVQNRLIPCSAVLF
jgi:hypothetical protein